MHLNNSTYLKVIYSIFFTIILPALLWLWSKRVDQFVQWPLVQSSVWGMVVLLTGLLLLLWGMYSIVTIGKGLPLNAYPPECLVTQGPYYFMRHPIYWGFGLILAGVSIYLGSPGCLWLVSPIIILCMIALVWGYERIQLKKKFSGYDQPVFFSFPEKNKEKPIWNHRLNAFVLPVTLLILSNTIINLFKGDPVSMILTTDFISLFPFSSDINYIILLFFCIIPFLPLHQSEFREWNISALWVNFMILYVAILWPEMGAQFFYRNDLSESYKFLGNLALPNFNILIFHGSWILLIGRFFVKAFPRLDLVLWIITFCLFINQVCLTDQPIANIITSVTFYIILIKRNRIWDKLRYGSEKIANSWKEWVFGPIRVINHGFYVGVSAFLGVILAGWLVGSDYVWAIVIFGFGVIIFSALWAQFIEGSERLKRPYGYYGALIGIIFSSTVVHFMGYDIWVVIGVVSVFMPWIQAIGRLRCLINGCCHGGITHDNRMGIRYFHPRSRVCGLSQMKGELLHPTPLYAIIWLLLIGFVLLSMWFVNESYSMIFGLYLILTGIGRFVEEAYRGEVQTPIVFGLRLYQWTAIISIIVGILMTLIHVQQKELYVVYDWNIMYSSIVLGLFTFFAMGVDFPKSNLRFSRLV